MYDLHTHSTASDGNLAPADLVEAAEKRSIKTLALTDHDTINGIYEASAEAKKRKMNFIPGIELEIDWMENKGGEFHLLGLGIKNPSENFIKAVEEMAERREKRNLQITEKMNSEGIIFSYDEVKSFSGGHSVGRPHFATLLVKRKMAKNIKQAFSRYLGKGKPYFIPRIGLDFERAVSVIHESGGYAILAHPMSLYIAWGRLPEVIKNLKDRGLDGLEAWHPLAKLSACRRLSELGKDLGLHISAGSDFHGPNAPDRKLGMTSGDQKITDSFLDESFKEILNSICI